METSYNPHEIETRWYQYWEEKDHFSPEKVDPETPTYCIMIPPPNVTGSLHMGHAFQDTIMDALTRYHRMKGMPTLWQPGMDHAGIATQMVVERLINAEGETRHDYGREKFVERVWQWKEESGGMITQQLRRMGASPDWANERFTMDEGLSDAVNEVFVQLYDDGIIYRGKRLVNWDPVLHTALSDLEVLSEEEQGHLWHLRYPIVDSDQVLTVATTRPETMLGDSAVAVHPSDERYQHLVGKYVHLPLTNRKIPIIADGYVDPEFGSGCVKITPAHDFNDYQVWVRHRQSEVMIAQPHGGLINLFTHDASIRSNINNEEMSEGELIPNQYVGLDRIEARKRIVKDFEDIGLLEKVEDHKLMIPRGDRTNAIVEPYLTDQWYVDLTREVQDDGRPGGKAVITDPSINVVKNGSIQFVPENWSKTYYQWLENIEDWCISRQIWWGHRIPAWYDGEGNIYVGKTIEAIREKYSLDKAVLLRQDEDVLDTWFSSALWPFSTLGWPEKTDRLQAFYPTSVLVTGFDIIFFWVARMIMMGTRFMGEVPFKEVYIHGLVRDAHGQKMSKSKGNVLDPIDIIDGIELEALVEKRVKGMMQPHLAEKIAKQTRNDFPDGIASFGTDALRFTFAALASNGRDVNFDLGRTAGYQNFCNKIWNAARFVLLQSEGKDCGQSECGLTLSLADRWIISKLQRTEKKIEQYVESYRFDLVAKEIYEFIWDNYCSWYLELCKPILNNDQVAEQAQIGTRQTLVRVFEAAMRLIHPIMPFISEEIWQQIAPHAGRTGDTIMTQPYPEGEEQKIDEVAEKQMIWLMDAIQCVRQIKGEMNISPAKKVPVLLSDMTEEQQTIWTENAATFAFLAKAQSVQVIDADEAPESAMKLAGQAKILIPLSDLIDKKSELARLQKEMENAKKEVGRLRGKLGNEKFVANAPSDIVEKEKEKLTRAESAMVDIEEQVKRIEKL
ncbi:MAG: valine--tRNA ligase [Gammaproteobacteria bacterium]|nr:valine--tRNA ligase [Gammaproteobacteria bacterium]